MAFRANISPQFGTLEDTKKVKLCIEGLVNFQGLNIKIENATDSKLLFEEKLSPHVVNFEREIDLKVVDSSKAIISIFVSIEEEKGQDKYELLNVIPLIFQICEKQDDAFKGKVVIIPSFAGLNDVCSLSVQSQPNEKLVFSLNTFKYNVLTNSKGEGSVHFRSKDILLNEKKVIHKIPVYVYLSMDNYRKAYFTGGFLNIISEDLKTFATIGTEGLDPICLNYDPITWQIPEWCSLNVGGPLGACDFPFVPSYHLPVKICDNSCTESCTCKNGTVTVDETICRIHSDSITLLSNGMILHVYVGAKSGEAGVSSSNKIFLTKDESSLDAQIITATYTTIAPKEALDDFILYIEEKLYDRIEELGSENKGANVVIFNEDLDYQSYPIIGVLSPDEYTPFYRVIVSRKTTDIVIEQLLTCQYSVFYEYSLSSQTSETVSPDVDISSIMELPDIEEEDILSPVRVCVSCNPWHVGESGESYVYIIAEAKINENIQLFYYGISMGSTGYSSTVSSGWQKITSIGNNQNAKIVVDKFNNAHIFWESDRTGQKQIYYGVLGPDCVSLGNTVLASILDKQAGVFKNEDKPFTYVSQNLLVPSQTVLEEISSNIIPDEYGYSFTYPNYGIIENEWTIYQSTAGQIVANEGDITLSADTFSTALAFTSLNDDKFFNIETGLESQINFQISFDMNGAIVQDKVSGLGNIGFTNNEVLLDYYYKMWKSKFTIDSNSSTVNSPIYSYGDNKFNISKLDGIYDKFIPIVGSYKNYGLENDFKAVVSGTGSTVKHFMLGFMPEKTRFKAINIEDEINFIERTGEQSGYVNKEIQEIYSSKGQFVFIFNFDEDIYGISPAHSIIRKISGSFDLSENQKVEILVNYSKIYLESCSNFFNVTNDLAINYPRFVCSVTLLLNENVVFSEAFLVNLSNTYRQWDIGFGFPSGGAIYADNFLPYNSSVFETANVSLNYSNIIISSPTYIFNEDILVIPSYTREQSNFSTYDYSVNEEDVNESFFNLYDLFYYQKSFIDDQKLIEIIEGSISPFDKNRQLPFSITEEEFLQVPITLEGENKSVNADIDINNNLHIVWQSNRNKKWDIYYSSSVNKDLPFRFDTQISNSSANSLSPDISVSKDGKRMVVWHDNRNKKYEVFSARALTQNSFYLSDTCENKDLLVYSNSILGSFNSVVFWFRNNIEKSFYFLIDFYNDDSVTSPIYSVNSKSNTEGWTVNGEVFPVEGIVSNELVKISFTPPLESPMRGKLLFVRIRPIY